MSGSVGTLVSAGLMFIVGESLFGRRAFGALTAALFLCTPVLMLHANEGTEMLVCLTAWLACAVRFATTGNERWLGVAGAVLGLELYRSDAALVMMPGFAALTMIWLAFGSSARGRSLALFAGVFLMLALPAAAIGAGDADYLAGAIVRLGFYDARAYGSVHGLREVINWNGMAARSGVYYDYFNPVFLFLRGDTFLEALAHARIFLMAHAVLMPAGLHHLLRPARPAEAWLLLGGLALAPVVPALQVAPDRPEGLVLMVPFATVIAVHGAKALLSSPRMTLRPIGLVGVAAVPLCIAMFLWYRP